MVVRENDLDSFISSWREKLFSVQNTILELLEGLDKLETENIINTGRDGGGQVIVKQERDEGTMCEEEEGEEEHWRGTQGLVEVKLKEDERMEEVRKEDQRTGDQSMEDRRLQDHGMEDQGLEDTLPDHFLHSGGTEDEGGTESESSHYFSNTHENTDERRYRCEICDFSTKVKFSLNRHMQIHEDNQIQKTCDKCSYTTTRLDYMKRHMKKRHQYNMYINAFNHESTSDVPERRLSRTRFEAPPVDFDKYSCNHCRYITTRIGDLKKHMSQEHPKENKSVQLRTSHHVNVIKTFK